jgi:hypothetical protein
VTRWLAEHREQIRISYLPSYSPEMNPDELLNQDVKTNALGRVRPINVQEMMDNVRAFLRITHARPTVVKNYFANATSDTQPVEKCHSFSARSNNFNCKKFIH